MKRKLLESNSGSSDLEQCGNLPKSPTFGPLVSTCAIYGIKRGMSFRLSREKKISTFCIFNKRFVVISSIEALAEVAPHE